MGTPSHPFLRVALYYFLIKTPDLYLTSKMQGRGCNATKGVERSLSFKIGEKTKKPEHLLPARKEAESSLSCFRTRELSGGPGTINLGNCHPRLRPTPDLEGSLTTVCYHYTLLLSLIACDYSDYFNSSSRGERQLQVPLGLPPFFLPRRL